MVVRQEDTLVVVDLGTAEDMVVVAELEEAAD